MNFTFGILVGFIIGVILEAFISVKYPPIHYTSIWFIFEKEYMSKASALFNGIPNLTIELFPPENMRKGWEGDPKVFMRITLTGWFNFQEEELIDETPEFLKRDSWSCYCC